MPSEHTTSIAVLLHLSNTRYWNDFADALQNISTRFDLVVNLVEGLNSPERIEQQITQIRTDFPHAQIILSANRGMDVGGMFRLFNYAMGKEYTSVFYAHSKSDNAWRQTMLDTLTRASASAIRMLNAANAGTGKFQTGMIGTYTYPYDYYNIGPFSSLMSELNLGLNTNWENYFLRYPNTRTLSFEQRLSHAVDQARHNTLQAGLRPELDLEYAEYLLGNILAPGQRMSSGHLRRMINDQVIGPLPYFPGNFFWISMSVILKLAGHIDFENEYLSLPLNLKSDKEDQSRAHAWERALPVFAAKNGFSLHALQK